MRYFLRRSLVLLGFTEGADPALGHLSLVLLLRTLVFLGALGRFAIHFGKYSSHPTLFRIQLAVISFFALYICTLLLLRQLRPATFVSEACQFVQIVLDVAIVASLYFLTGKLDSDFFLFFVVPLLLPTTMNWRGKSLVAPLLSAAALLALVILIPRHFVNLEGPSSLVRDLLRKFFPRVGFVIGVSLLVNLLLEFRRDAVSEVKEKTDLQELMDKMRRQASVVAASPNGAGNGAGQLEPAQMALNADELQPGQKLGHRYKILSLLGKGGMGAVYQAQDLELDDVVAVKVLTSTRMPSGTQGIVTLKKEIRLQRRITHPNVVRVHDLGEIAGLQFLTMELVPGTTLKELVARRVAIPLGPSLQIFKQLVSGLEAIHAAGIIHRDIKPENVMALPNGTIKLMDFGVAQLVLDLDAGAEKGLIAGSPFYMSPEQLLQGRLDHRSDLYSVGVMMFQAFTGLHPFAGGKLRDVIRDQVSTTPVSPREKNPELPEELERLILSCLAKDPDGRPESAQAIYASLLSVPVN